MVYRFLCSRWKTTNSGSTSRGMIRLTATSPAVARNTTTLSWPSMKRSTNSCSMQVKTHMRPSLKTSLTSLCGCRQWRRCRQHLWFIMCSVWNHWSRSVPVFKRAVLHRCRHWQTAGTAHRTSLHPRPAVALPGEDSFGRWERIGPLRGI